jgi:hypothetical protein
VTAVRHQQDHAANTHVALLDRHTTRQSLDVAEASLGLHHDFDTRADHECVCGSEVAGDRDRHLNAHSKVAAKPASEALEERKVTGIADRAGDRVDAEGQLLTEDGGDPRQDVDADMRRQATLDPDHLGVRDADDHRETPHAQPSCLARDP